MAYVVIKAGGAGYRIEPWERPKQFIEIQGIPIIIYTLKLFEDNPEVEAICVSCISGWEGYLENAARVHGISKLRWIVQGGNVAQRSIYNGIQKVGEFCAPNEVVVIHDAVRPMISQRVIRESILTAGKYGTAVVTTPCFESILVSENGKECTSICDFHKMFIARAPQSYRYDLLSQVYHRAEEQGITNSVSTDELFIQMGYSVRNVIGNTYNFKITTVEDVELFAAIVSSRKEGIFYGRI